MVRFYLHREWNVEERRPGAKQSKNIDEKRTFIAGFLDLPLHQVIPISANEKYNLMELVDSIVHALPSEQKIIVLEKIQKAEDEAIAAKLREAELKYELEISKAKSEVEIVKAQAEAEKAKAEAEKARAETKISESARREAEKGFFDTLIKTVDSAIGTVKDVVFAVDCLKENAKSWIKSWF